MRTRCEKEAPTPGSSMGNLNFSTKPVNLSVIHP